MKLKTFMLKTATACMAFTVLAAGSLKAFASEEQNAPVEQKVVTLNHTDVLDNLLNVDRLFYHGDFTGRFIVNTEPYLNIQSEERADSDVVGKIYPQSVGTVTKWGPEWTEVQSGTVKGYLPTKSLYIGFDAEKAAKDLGIFKVKITADSLNIRDKASEEGAVIGTASQNEDYTVLSRDDQWVRVQNGEVDGYLSKEYVEEYTDLKEAVSIEEEEAQKKAAEEKKVEEAKAVDQPENKEEPTQQAQQQTPQQTAPSVSVSSDEEYLLACMVYVESGAESYEGQLAVANVIMNRVRSASFPNSIAEVIYAPGQFPGAHNGVLDGVLASGPSESTMQAAREAIAGVNNIGDYMFFNGYVDTSSVGSYTVIGGHTFYNY